MLTDDELPKIERFDPTGKYCLGILFGELTGNRKTQQISSMSPRRSKCLPISVADRENGSPWVALVCNVIHIDSGIQSYIVNRYNSRSVTFIVV